MESSQDSPSRCFLASRAATALRARSLRCSGVMLAAAALPPRLPCLRKYSSTSSGSFFFGTRPSYPERLRWYLQS